LSLRGHYVAVLAAPLLVAGTAAAQGGPPTFQISFSNPGARSMGLGGAFVALADDATAAFANPAGLVQLIRPEVSVEGRYWSYSTPYTEGGRLIGQPTGIGLDSTAGLRTAESEEDFSGLSFVSFVYPERNWSLALYRHQLAKFRFRSETQGLFIELQPGTVDRVRDIRASLDIDILSYGLAGALRVSDALSVGLGITYFDGSLAWTGSQFFIDEFPDTFYEPNSYLPERMWGQATLIVDDTDWAMNLGFLWTPSETWRVGGVYRRGPEFTYDAEERAGPAHDEAPEGALGAAAYGVPIGFPDVYGLGVAYRSARGSLTVGFEWDRVEYSTLIDSIESDVVETEGVVLEDGDEYHLGVEIVVLDSTPLIAVRGGVWYDPDHRVRSEDPDPLDRALLTQGDDTLHYALGFGLAFRSFQLDVGVDLSDLVDTASLSLIYSF
jgi:long-subunit fatty acid transport protein